MFIYNGHFKIDTLYQHVYFVRTSQDQSMICFYRGENIPQFSQPLKHEIDQIVIRCLQERFWVWHFEQLLKIFLLQKYPNTEFRMACHWVVWTERWGCVGKVLIWMDSDQRRCCSESPVRCRCCHRVGGQTLEQNTLSKTECELFKNN